MRAGFPANQAGLLHPVTGEYLAAGFADFGAIGLQAIEDGEHIRVVVVLDQFLAVFDHVEMASGALLFVSLSEAGQTRHRWRLRWRLRRYQRGRDQKKRSRKNERSKHD